jgi:hypothetical protein
MTRSNLLGPAENELIEFSFQVIPLGNNEEILSIVVSYEPPGKE